MSTPIEPFTYNPFTSFNRCTVAFITNSTLKHKIMAIAFSIFSAVPIFIVRTYRFIPLATLLPAVGVTFFATLIFAVVLMGHHLALHPRRTPINCDILSE